jgi:hypothetical protein
MNENILKDFFDFAIKDVAHAGIHYGNADRPPWQWEKDRGINKNQLSIMQIGKDWTDGLPWNYENADPNFPKGHYDFLIENLDLEDLHAFLEMVFNEAMTQRHEMRRMKGEDITFSQEERNGIIEKLQDQYNPYNFKTSKWNKVSATPELIQKMQDQFYDLEQGIVANYVQQTGKSITVNPRNLEYWEKADIVSDLMQDRNFVSNVEAGARIFADGFIKQYNINDPEIVKEKFLEAIEEEINEVRDRYLNDIYNQIYLNAEKIGKDIAEHFMDNDPGDVERWPVKARLDEIKNLEEGYSNLSEYAHMWDFYEIYSFQSVAAELEQADLDPGYEAWNEGIEEGFYSSINVGKIEDLLGTDTSYLYEPIDPSREAYLGPEQTDENEAKKHRREIADKWKIEYDKSKRDRLNWATEEDFPKKRWESSVKKSNNEEHTPQNARQWGEMAAIHNAPFDNYVFIKKPRTDYDVEKENSLYSLVELMSLWDIIVESYNEETQDFIYSAFWDSEEKWIFEEEFDDDFWEGFWEEVNKQYDSLKQQISNDFAKALKDEINNDLADLGNFSSKEKINFLTELSQVQDEEEYTETAIKYLMGDYHYYVYDNLKKILSESNEWPIAKDAIEKYNQASKSLAENVEMPSIEDGFLYVKNRVMIDLSNLSNGSISSKSKIKYLMGNKEVTEWLEDRLFSSILSSQDYVNLQNLANLQGISLDKIEQMIKEWIAEYVNSPEAKEEVYKTVDMPTVEGEVWKEPVEPAREDLLGPEEYDINEGRKRRKEIRDKWKVEPGKVEWATDEDFPKKPWDFTSGFKKMAELSPELIELATQMAKDVVPHPLDYMRAQEENYGRDYIPEYHSIILAQRKNWLDAIDTAQDSMNEGLWYNLNDTIQDPYLDEDLKEEIEENVDEFRDEVLGQTDPFIDKMWQETIDDYVNEISNTYDDIIFEAINRLIEDINEYWDRKEVGQRVNAFMSEQVSALDLLDGLTVYAERELDWLQDLHPVFEQVKENALKSANTYITEKIPDLVQYTTDVGNETINQMYEPVDPSQEPYLGPEETDENEARKHRKEIKDKWKIEPNQPLEWATEEDFPKKPWDFRSKVAAPNPFLPRLYHAMVENLKRTATFDWEADSNAWNKVKVAYEILNDWDDYVQEIKEDSGYKGENSNLSALMRDVFIDIFTPVWETISYLPLELQSEWMNLHSNIAGTYPSTPYQIDAKLFNIFQPSDRRQDPSDISKELREERTEEIKDKWEAEDWWKGSKWKKIAADEEDEEEEDEEERRSFDEIEWEISQNIPGFSELQSVVEDFVFSETSTRDFIQEFLFPLNKAISEQQMIQAADFFQSQQNKAEELVERFYDRTDFFYRLFDHLTSLIIDNFNWDSIVTTEEYDYYGNSLDDVLYEEAREASNAIGQEAEGLIVDQIEDFLREGGDYIWYIYQEQAANRDRRITPDQEMMDVYDIMGELPDIPYEPQPVSPQVAEWMRQQSKVANIEDWSTPETSILMDEINRDSRILKPAIKTMEKIVRKGGTSEDLAAWLIENVLTPYNEHIGNQWEQISDEQDVEAQKNELRKTWKQQARKQFPFSLEKQKQYVKEMEQTQFGLLGDPEPEEIENYLLKVENINWQEIYDWVKEDLQYRGKIASSQDYDDVYKKLYRGGVSYGVAAVKDLIRRETSREPYEHIDYSNPTIRKILPQPDRFYDEDQLSVFREMIEIDDDIKQIAQAHSKTEFKNEPMPLGYSEEELNDAINDGTQHFLRGYKDAINGKYKHQLDLSRKLRKDPELWKSSAPEQKEEDKYIYKLLNLLMACAKEGRSNAFRSLALHGEQMGMKLVDTNEMMETRDYRLDENQLKIWPEMVKPDPEKDFSNLERGKLLASYAIGGPELDNFIRSLPDGDEIQVDERVNEAMSDAFVIGYESALRNISFIDSVPEVGNLLMEKFSTHGQRQMAIGDEVAETHFEGVPEDPNPEPEEKEVNGKKWKMVRPKPNKQPADYAKPKSGWGFYSRHKKSESEAWIDRVTDSTRRDIEKILNDLPDKLKMRATLDADDTVRDWVRHAFIDQLSWNSPQYNPAKGMWEDSEGYTYDLNPYEKFMLPFHNTEKSRLIHKNQVNLGIEQVRSMADLALYRHDRFDGNLRWEINDLVQLYFSDLGYLEQESFVKEILRLLTPLDERELEQMYNDAYYKSWEKAFNDEVADLESSQKTSKKDAWEAVIDGELGHDILTTGTWDKVKKQTIKWLEELKDGYINKKNLHDNKKIDSEAKEQDGHALESLKSYEGEKRWSFHFDHGKHPYDLIIQPVGYKESAKQEKESKWKVINSFYDDYDQKTASEVLINA